MTRSTPANALKLFWQTCIAILLLSVGLGPITARAQSGAVLSQEREGSASVYVSAEQRRAYIFDGGKTGGLTKPRLEGKSVLDWLFSKGYHHLVISCSHPHEDHSAGLVEIIRSDPNIEKFETIHFVDSGYPVSSSLFQLFKQCHPNFASEKISYASASARDGFAHLFPLDEQVSVHNFIYEPEPGDSAHGHAIIAQITLQKDGIKTLIVDFDDANSTLVQKWADWAEADPASRRPNVIIAPHHCSDLTDIAPLLKPSIRPDACVITANSNNKYLHPGPLMFQKWVDALGVANVHITGASFNIRIAHQGLPPITDYDEMARIYFYIVQPNLNEYQKELESIGKADVGSEKGASSLSGTLAKCQALSVVSEKYIAVLHTMDDARKQRELAEMLLKADLERLLGLEPQSADFGRDSSVVMKKCEYCGQDAVGWCHIRNKWVCEQHRYFTSNGESWRCP